MAKKIRFPLEMDGGIEVRDINSLRENFSLQRVMGYLADGKLITWLRDRYANDFADAIETLDKDDNFLAKELCEIFGVEFDEEAKENLEKAEARNKKLARLKKFSLEKEYRDNIGTVAFEQEDLYDLLDEDADRIYLCGEYFSIPLAQEGITYIGVNNPVVVIDSKVEIDWKEKKISLSGVRYDSKYQEVLESAEAIRRKLYQKAVSLLNEQGAAYGAFMKSKLSAYGKYMSSSYINFMLTPADKKNSEISFDLIVKEIGSMKYDIDDDIQNARKLLGESKIVNLAEKYLKNL